MPLSILHLVSYPIFSGPLGPTLALAQRQKSAGHRVWFAYDSKRGAHNGYEEAAEPRVAASGLDPLPLTLSTKSSPMEMLNDRSLLRRFVSECGIDVVHCHMSHDHSLAALSLPRARPPVRVRTFHSARSLEMRLGQSWINAQADAYIVRCGAHRDLLQQRFEIGGKPTEIIPGSVDTSIFSPMDAGARERARDLFGIPYHARVIGHVALIAGRGQEELAGAVAAVNHEALHVLYVGRGEEEHALRLAIDTMGLGSRVHFAGYLQGNALQDAYAAMDAAFIARPGNDASARAVLEAMASGVVPVVVPKDALGEAVTPMRGYHAHTCCNDDIATALRDWLRDDAAHLKAKAARSFVAEHRTIQGEAEAAVRLYERSLEGSSEA